MPRPKAIDHVGLKVSDMDRALAFYQALGLEVLRTMGPHADGGRSAVIRVGRQEMNLFYRPGLGTVEIENAVGVDHFCLDMDAPSMEALVADLRRAGLAIASGPVERRDGTSVFVQDPDGVRVELRIARVARADG